MKKELLGWRRRLLEVLMKRRGWRLENVKEAFRELGPRRWLLEMGKKESRGLGPRRWLLGGVG